jgi:7-carboxy-7-deazaguanine synthase
MTTALAVPSLVIAEVFGPTIQGEGPSLGRRASFIRLGGCNLHCTWCDTGYTWDATRYDLRTELRRASVLELLEEVESHRTTLSVVTGGEPLLHQHQTGWLALLDGLRDRGEIEVETNGTLAPTPDTCYRVARFNVSPKLNHAGDAASQRIRPDVLQALAATGHAAFKFVVRTKRDLDEIATVAVRAGIPHDTVWIMPEGVTPLQILHLEPGLADEAIAYGFNLTTRLHVLLWPSERKR